MGIANRTCHDLLAHEEHSGSSQLRGWWQFDSPLVDSRDVLAPIGSVIGPKLKDRASEVTELLGELQELPDSLPFNLELGDGSVVQITEEMVTRKTVEVTSHGEYFTPHVIEPAFGIDRIVWHILDHNFREVEKVGENYTILSLNQEIAPFDVSVLPLFDKDGMGEMARGIATRIREIKGIVVDIDSSRSIGRRYARCDEIGVPWALTVDHTSLEEGSVTVRRRDDQLQVRALVDDIIIRLANGTMEGLF